jgi:molybdopterin synthase catalytic subunit
MTLEHYPAMTERALAAIADEAARRWPLAGLTVIHRFGRLVPGDRIVFVATASAHRAAALEACAFLIDWLKTDAPFWKCEAFADGSRRWVEAKASDDDARTRWT